MRDTEAMDEHHPPVSDRDMERTILELLAKRAEGATICPSEAARAAAGEDWRDQMDAARSAAQRLVVAGVVDITQRGEVVDLATASGPIRIRGRPTAPDARQS